MHKIGVISDTHGLLRAEVREMVKDCDAILHAGDIHRPQILEELKRLAPLYAVRGNADKEWAAKLPAAARIDLFGVGIYMIHNKKQICEDISDRDIVVSGHSHRYEESEIGGQVWLNPGSCGPRRFGQPVTMAVIRILPDGSFTAEKTEFTGRTPQNGAQRDPGGITRELAEAVIRDVDAGRTVADIARRNQIEKETAEQLCRLYVTHPGIDAEGILNKIG